MMLETERTEGNGEKRKRVGGGLPLPTSFRFELLSVSSLFLFFPLLSVLSVRAQESNAQPNAPWDARIASVEGSVTLITSDNPEGIPASEGLPLESGDRLRTDADGRVQIAFEGDSLVTIEPDSNFAVESLKKSESSFGIVMGSLLAQFKSLLQGEALRVRTPTAVAAVRGTQFGVDVENGEASHIGVFDEGHLEVAGLHGEAPQTIGPNQETAVRKGMAPERPSALKRMARYQERVRGFRQRLRMIRRGWRTLPSGRRQAFRQKAIQRMRERRERIRSKMQQRRAQTERAQARRQEWQRRSEKQNAVRRVQMRRRRKDEQEGRRGR